MDAIPLEAAAVELIREALAPVGTIEIRSASSKTSEDLRVSTAPGERAHVIQLKRWGGKSEQSKLPHGSSLVWVLTNAPPELLRRLRAGAENFVDVKRGVVRLALPR